MYVLYLIFLCNIFVHYDAIVMYYFCLNPECCLLYNLLKYKKYTLNLYTTFK